jgi:hypothetical protein
MNAIKQVRRFLLEQPDSPSAKGLARLTEDLAMEGEFPLSALYDLDTEAFELAIELLRDWRLDRYYAARIKLFDVVLNAGQREPGSAAAVSDSVTAEESVA